MHHTWLVVSTRLKSISQVGLLFPIYGKNNISNMFKAPTRYLLKSNLANLPWGTTFALRPKTLKHWRKDFHLQGPRNASGPSHFSRQRRLESPPPLFMCRTDRESTPLKMAPFCHDTVAGYFVFLLGIFLLDMFLHGLIHVFFR